MSLKACFLILKKIGVKDGNRKFEFYEKVRVYELEELKQLHVEAGLEPIEVYGDYNLGGYNELNSPRMLLVSRKKR
jgi:hypothetical protein